MSRKNVMVNGGTLGFDTGSPVSGGSFTITTPASTTMLVDGDGVYAGPLAWTFSGGNASGAASGTVVGAGTINPTAQKVKNDGKLAILEGDSVVSTFNGVTPDGKPISFPGVTVKVTSSGQTVVLGE